MLHKWRFLWVMGGIMSIVLIVALRPEQQSHSWGPKTSVMEVLLSWGASPPDHYMGSPDSSLIKKGRDLVHNGYTKRPNGKKTPLQSKHFTCTSCHNVQKEYSNLGNISPEERLQYSIDKNIPFLQGSSLYGVVNREQWYNGDYLEKYGKSLILPARDSLKAAIQVCATTCSQGRAFTEWELKAVLAYFWSLQLKLNDLSFSEEQWEKLKTASTSIGPPGKRRQWLKQFYYQRAPAEFGEPPKDLKKGYALQGEAEKGKYIYSKSCLHCHQPGGIAEPVLDNSPTTYHYLKKRFNTYKWERSLYPLLREGTHPAPGDRDYMPNYTINRLSNQQIEHLRAFIEQKVQQHSFSIK